VAHLHEGARVSYIGDGHDGRALGEHGRLLAITGRSGHVKWEDRTITLVDLNDVAALSPSTAAARPPADDDLADSLDVGPVRSFGVRGVYEVDGTSGVLSALASTGQLTGFASIAEDTRLFAEGRVRQDPELSRAAAQLDPEEADELIAMATAVLLRDAFGALDGD
jgi:hypothetical protein